jgi:hypothetical protein
MANRRDAEFRATNGEMVTVSRVDSDGRIHLDDGRTVPPSYRQFDYGWARAQASQKNQASVPSPAHQQGQGHEFSR